LYVNADAFSEPYAFSYGYAYCQVYGNADAYLNAHAYIRAYLDGYSISHTLSPGQHRSNRGIRRPGRGL
jgi:hypothetical protein